MCRARSETGWAVVPETDLGFKWPAEDADAVEPVLTLENGRTGQRAQLARVDGTLVVALRRADGFYEQGRLPADARELAREALAGAAKKP